MTSSRPEVLIWGRRGRKDKEVPVTGLRWLHRPLLRWRSGRRLRMLGLPRRFTLAELRSRAREQLGREVRFTAVPLPTSMSGLTLMTDEYVVVVADSRTFESHRWYIWGHELAHPLWSHLRRQLDEDIPILRALFPTLPLDMVHTRTSCGGRTEAEAEMLGSLITAGLEDLSPEPDDIGDLPGDLAKALHRVQDTFG